MRVFSCGAGVQSTAALVLTVQGDLDYDAHVFANVGDDSENPETIRYFEDVLLPYAASHGVRLVEAQKRRLGKYEKQTLLGEIYRRERSIPIPARMSNGAPGNRACTVDFKIRVVDKYLAETGGKGADHYVGLGITVDEIHRARKHEPERVRGFTKHIEYPLIDLGLSRSACQAIVKAAGLPEPPRSACWFCPFHSPAEWTRLRASRPDLFQQAVDLESHINEKRGATLKKDKVWLHPALRPLEQAVGQQMTFDELENCDGGYCFV